MSSTAAVARLGGDRGAKRKESGVSEVRSFGVVLRDLLIERGLTTSMGNPNWSAFADSMEDVHYETLRKAVTGDRAPAPVLMERVAAALGVEPDVFEEYALWRAQRMFDPREVGLEAASENLRLFSESQKRKSKR